MQDRRINPRALANPWARITIGNAAISRATAGLVMAERDTEHIVRQWNREIEEETRRLALRGKNGGAWRAVVWAAIWLLWLGALLALIGLMKSLE